MEIFVPSTGPVPSSAVSSSGLSTSWIAEFLDLVPVQTFEGLDPHVFSLMRNSVIKSFVSFRLCVLAGKNLVKNHRAKGFRVGEKSRKKQLDAQTSAPQ